MNADNGTLEINILQYEGPLDPVSYTHLDVYKRQLYHLSGNTTPNTLKPSSGGTGRRLKTANNMFA